MDQLSASAVRQLLHYEETTGCFRWLVRAARNVFPGDSAGTVNSFGYTVIKINHKSYKAHRIAWLLKYGAWPTYSIDHINGETSDNRICNLRECTASDNSQNRKLGKNNTSGYLGVRRLSGRWSAEIQLNRKKQFLGLFDTPQDAHAAYCARKKELHTFKGIDKERELHIKHCAQLMEAAMGRYEASNCFADRAEADAWRMLMEEAIRGRSVAQVRLMEVERGFA